MFTKITYLKDAISYVEAEGKLDIYNAPDYLEEIKEHLKKLYTKELILEFSKITFIASIGLRTILELHKIMQDRNCILKLKNVRKEVLSSFSMTGFDKFLIIENDSDNKKEKELAVQDMSTLIGLVKTELKDILEGLNRWHEQIARIMGCNSSVESIESSIIKTLLLNDKNFDEAIETYEKISHNEYINDWTNQKITFNKEIQKLFSDLIPKLIDIRARIQQN